MITYVIVMKWSALLNIWSRRRLPRNSLLIFFLSKTRDNILEKTCAQVAIIWQEITENFNKAGDEFVSWYEDIIKECWQMLFYGSHEFKVYRYAQDNYFIYIFIIFVVNWIFFWKFQPKLSFNLALRLLRIQKW